MVFFNQAKRFLGIDVGTFSTKIVELSYSKKGTVVLKNYAEKIHEIDISNIYKSSRKRTLPLPHKEIADNIKILLNEMGSKKDEVAFSIPDFMTFFTVFKTPTVPKEEMESIVQFEARQHIPLPLSEVSLDWSIINKNKEKLKTTILLVAVPNNVIAEYQKIADLAKIKITSIEAEVFSLTRAVIKGENLNKIIQLIDVGIQSTTITIVDKGIIKTTYSIDFSEMETLKGLVDKLNISYNQAEDIKNKTGFNEQLGEGKVLCQQADILINEIKKINSDILKTKNKELDKIILSGGLSLSPGFKDYVILKTGKQTEIGNPFSDFSYPAEIKNILEKIGPRYAIATGLALRDRK